MLSLAQSKDTLYAVIDRESRGGMDGVAGIYTDYFVPLDCNPDSQAVCNARGED